MELSWFVAFSAGLLSFVSPCVLPLVPSYISYITGLSLEDLTAEAERGRVRRVILSNSLAFIGGFSFVFILFGASATLIGRVLLTHQHAIRQIGGVLIILFGLYIMGVLKLRFLGAYKQLRIENKPAGYAGSFLVGIGFAAGWTPCVGPILGAILLLAGTTGSVSQGIELLAVYSVGLGLPLLLTALGLNLFLANLRRFSAYLRGVSIASGIFLIGVGVMIFTNSFTVFTALLTEHGIGWYIGQ